MEYTLLVEEIITAGELVGANRACTSVACIKSLYNEGPTCRQYMIFRPLRVEQGVVCAILTGQLVIVCGEKVDFLESVDEEGPRFNVDGRYSLSI